MVRTIILIGIIVVLMVPAIVCAQTAAAPQTQPAPVQPAAPVIIGPAKLAWLNLEQAILTCDDGKREFGGVQQYVDKKTLKNQLNVQGAKLTDEARADLEEQIESKDTYLQRFQQDTQKDIEGRRTRVVNAIGRKMIPVIEKIAKEKGLSAVLYINPTRDAYIDVSLIITDEVIKAYNMAYPAGAAKAPAAPAPAKKP
jgi:Skp family chaperone for outer membrane proteins